MKEMKPFTEELHVTRPILPDIDIIYNKLKVIWDSKKLTNFGNQQKEFLEKLKSYLNCSNLSLFCNGTQALEIGLNALDLKGEVITTAFTFPATVHSIFRNNLKPVFCDIEDEYFNIDSDLIEDLITPNTTAILAVHIFGNPCEINKIERIAKKYNLKLIYDAAAAFGVAIGGKSIAGYGDVSIFSFHATKVFNTFEGGAISYKDKKLESKLHLLRNFGIKNEEEVILPGTNAKMDEFNACIGILNLQNIEKYINKRKQISSLYRLELNKILGIITTKDMQNVKYNYAYMPIIIDKEEFGISRDQLYDRLKKYNIFTRKYFYPIATDYEYIRLNPLYQNVCLPIANKISKQVLCLPIYPDLEEEKVIKICNIIDAVRLN